MWARHWRIHLLHNSRGFISQPKELFSPLLMTCLLEWQDKARDCSLEDWGEASAVSSYLPPSSLHHSPDSSDSIIAISRVSPLSLISQTRSVRDRRSHRVPEKSLAVILVTILREFSHLIACSSHEPAVLQSTHCRAHVIIELLPELLIEEFSVTLRVDNNNNDCTLAWYH